MLSDESVRRWYDNLASSSPHTADVAVRRLYRFSELSGVDHNALLRLDQPVLENLVQDTIRKLEKNQNAPDYINGILKGVKSWLKHNDRELRRDIKIRNLGVPVTLEDEKVPEPSELAEIQAAASMRAKVSCSFMAFSGLRPEVLGGKYGDNGLVLGDLPELDIENLTFRMIPAQVIVRRELSKVKHQYFSFLNEKGCSYLLTYLKDRRAHGEKLAADSPVIRANYVYKKRSFKVLGRASPSTFFLCTLNISEEIKRAIVRAGYNWRPYILRAYFDSHLLSAELKGLLSGEARSWFMGHRGSIERKYTLNKHRLPRELFSALQSQYLKGSTFLTVEPSSPAAIEEKLEQARDEVRKSLEKRVDEQDRTLKFLINVLGLKVSGRELLDAANKTVFLEE